jgi:hypothetical protein
MLRNLTNRTNRGGRPRNPRARNNLANQIRRRQYINQSLTGPMTFQSSLHIPRFHMRFVNLAAEDTRYSISTTDILNAYGIYNQTYNSEGGIIPTYTTVFTRFKLHAIELWGSVGPAAAAPFATIGNVTFQWQNETLNEFANSETTLQDTTTNNTKWAHLRVRPSPRSPASCIQTRGTTGCAWYMTLPSRGVVDLYLDVWITNGDTGATYQLNSSLIGAGFPYGCSIGLDPTQVSDVVSLGSLYAQGIIAPAGYNETGPRPNRPSVAGLPPPTTFEELDALPTQS